MRLVSRYSRWCSTKVGSSVMRSRCTDSLFHAELLERARVVGPILAHLHPQVEVQALAEPGVELLASFLTDALQTRTLRADHDGLLAFAVHPDDGVDHELPLFFFLLLDLDGDAVRHLF